MYPHHRVSSGLFTGVLLLTLLAAVTGPANSQPTPAKTMVNSIGMKFVLIPNGTFQMGSTTGDKDEQPVHQVTISKPFSMGETEVTQAQWQAIMGTNPSLFQGDPKRPVEQVWWDDVQAFIRKLNEKEGGNLYRLPTEAEWEYAARAGTTTAYSFGDDASVLGQYAWYKGNAGEKTHPVAQLKPNAWGLYDMHGNVWEWVQDWYQRYSAEAVTDPQGPTSGTHRGRRGGAWNNLEQICRSSNRYSVAGYRDDFLGFRLVRTLP
ncbi:MAG: formylglycine-generating enzyme family protein [Candidatus Tectomicrobia bacterium]|nr:formylglycine-generating enzyme family protein [Candidatus Tectomicrobia bacterium]